MKKTSKSIFLISVFFCTALSCFAQNFSASKSSFIEDSEGLKITANENGVYPVRLTWSKEGVKQKLYVFDDSAQDFVLLYSGNNNEYIHITSTTPGQKLQYKLCSYNSSDKLISEQSDYGWGALTGEAYLTLYTTMLDKTQKRLTLMNKKGVLEKLGSESIEGLVSGTLSYNTKIVGFSGLVTMLYENYQDFDDWLFEGSISTKANISANGTIAGTMKVSGMYPGTVIYDNARLKAGIPGDGYYTVLLDGFAPADVDFKYYIVLDPQ